MVDLLMAIADLVGFVVFAALVIFLAGYKLQEVCEDCGAWLDWDNVINGMEELEKRRK